MKKIILCLIVLIFISLNILFADTDKDPGRMSSLGEETFNKTDQEVSDDLSLPVGDSNWITIDSTMMTTMKLYFEETPYISIMLEDYPEYVEAMARIDSIYSYDEQTRYIMRDSEMNHFMWDKFFDALEEIIAIDSLLIESILKKYKITYESKGKSIGYDVHSED